MLISVVLLLFKLAEKVLLDEEVIWSTRSGFN